MRELILEIKNGTFSYGEQRGIRNIRAKIHKGERIAVIGSNGAGKSTFFLSLNGVNRLEEGELYYRGKLIDGKRRSLLELRKHVGIVFQDPDHQIIASTVEGEISFGLFNIGTEPEEVRRQVGHVMEETKLMELAGRPPHFLSGGQKKQVTVADILVMNPEVILFDEPTAGLDCKNTRILRKQLDQLHQRDVTLLISTHDMNFVWEWADRVIVFSGGEIIADDTPDAVFGMEEIMEQASLQKPVFYEISEYMGLRTGNGGYIRTLEEWKERLGSG